MIDWTVSPSMETPPTTDDTTRRHNTRCGRGRYMNFLVEFGLSLVRGQRLTQPYFLMQQPKLIPQDIGAHVASFSGFLPGREILKIDVK